MSPSPSPMRLSEPAARAVEVVRTSRVADAALRRARLRVVPRAAGRTRTHRVPFVVLISTLLLAGVVGLLLFNTSMQQASFSATRLEAQAADLTARREALGMQLDEIRDPQRLATQAREMGMVPATGAAFLDADTGEVIGEPVPAVREDDLPLDPLPPRPPAAQAPRPADPAAETAADPDSATPATPATPATRQERREARAQQRAARAEAETQTAAGPTGASPGGDGARAQTERAAGR